MLSNLCKLECKVNGKLYQFLCDTDSPIECVEEALAQFLAFAVRVKNEHSVSAADEDMKQDESEENGK